MRKKQAALQSERTELPGQARVGHFSETSAKWAGHSLPAPDLPPLNGISQNEDNCIGLQDPEYLSLLMLNQTPGDAMCHMSGARRFMCQMSVGELNGTRTTRGAAWTPEQRQTHVNVKLMRRAALCVE